MFEKGSELLLDDDRRYVVTEGIRANGTDYLCLTSCDDKKKVRLVKQVDNGYETYVEDVEDKMELLNLMESLIKIMKTEVNT